MKNLIAAYDRSGKLVKVVGNDPATFRFVKELYPGDQIIVKSIHAEDLYNEMPDLKVIDQIFVYQGNGFFQYKYYQRRIDEPDQDFYKHSLRFFFVAGFTFQVIATPKKKSIPTKDGTPAKKNKSSLPKAR